MAFVTTPNVFADLNPNVHKMAKSYKGTLSLDWYNKQQSILLRGEGAISLDTDVPAPKINWVNKDEALFYEIDSEGGIGQIPYWVDRNDIRVKEARPLILQKVFKSVAESKPGTLDGMDTKWRVVELNNDDLSVENILIKGDNLLALNTLKKMFDNMPEDQKVKCIYIDPPYNTGQAFENYDDNLEQSEWLTLMRDRLVILHKLLREDGVLFIQLDEKNIFHVRVMLDEIFGKQNYLNFFTLKTSDPSGFKTVNPSPYDSAEYILLYAKNKPSYKYETLYVKSEYDSGYNRYITNMEAIPQNWNIIDLKEKVAHHLGYKDAKNAQESIGKLDFIEKVADFALNNSERVFQATAISNKAGAEVINLREESMKNKDTVLLLKRESDTVYVLNGRQLSFYSTKIKSVDGERTPSLQLTNIWTDIPYNGISKEGGVKFQESKKPEKLIKRIIEVANAKEGDLILDCFGGSGTTFAVATKMKMKWIGVEIGNHADTHIVPRLKTVLDASDQAGVTKTLSWKGGGSFKYYHLGQSFIKINKDGTGDFNWSLGKKFIEESFLSSYDYILDKTVNLSEGQLFPDQENTPSIGIQAFGTKKRVAVISLNEPGGKKETLSYEEIFHIYSTIKKQINPEYINIFTNKGLELAYDSKPDDLDVIKVPHAIFSELEK